MIGTFIYIHILLNFNIQIAIIITEAQYIKIITIPSRTFAKQRKDCKENMVDPKRVLSYEDMLKVIHQPQKVIIDVRNPDEVNTTGKIPSSINIPCNYYLFTFF